MFGLGIAVMCNIAHSLDGIRIHMDMDMVCMCQGNEQDNPTNKVPPHLVPDWLSHFPLCIPHVTSSSQREQREREPSRPTGLGELIRASIWWEMTRL